MNDDARVRRLLEEALDTGRTPEDVCSPHPELLGEVRRRWVRIQDLADNFQHAFPTSGRPWPLVAGGAGGSNDLPDIPGYELQALVGHGGMGVVYRAKQISLDRIIAIKMLRFGEHSPAREISGLVSEAKSIASLRHPHIVQVHDVGEFNGLPYFTMEFVEGGSLAQKLAGQPQSAMKSAEWVSALARAVGAAHERGIVHRDLKPGNVLVCADGALKITDFGLARHVTGDGETVATIAAARFGTPSYMPPEQALGTPAAFKPAADIYSLGAILYEMLTGRPPFRGESITETERQVIDDEPVSPSRLNPMTPRDLQTICLKCLQKPPERRYSSARELADDLDRFRGGEPIRARPIGVAERSMKWVRRRPVHASLLAVALIVMAIGIVFGVWFQGVVATRRAELAFRQTESRQAIRRVLDQTRTAIRGEAWNEADRLLVAARDHVSEASSMNLSDEIESLGQAIRLARGLEQTRQSRLIIDSASISQQYSANFRDAGFRIDDGPHLCAAVVQASPISQQMIAALDDWASIAFDLQAVNECEQLLAIAREADPGSAWKDRFRTQTLWADQKALLELADEAGDVASFDDAPMMHQLGLLGIRLGEKGAADVGSDLLRTVLRQRPNDFWMNWELGRCCFGAGRFEAAIAPLGAAVAVRPENAYACGLLAGALSETGNLDEGIPMFHRALKLGPDSTPVRRNLVVILCRNGRWHEAEEQYQWWRGRIDHWGVDARRFFVPHLVDTHRYEEALAIINEIREHETTDTGILGYMGASLLELGRLAEAEAAFREFARLDPNAGMPHGWLHRILARMGRIDEAIAEGQAAVDLSIKMSSLQPPLGELLLARGRMTESSAAFEDLTRGSPSEIEGYFGLIRTQLGLKQFNEARMSLDRAFSRPASTEQLQQLARLGELHKRISEIDARDPEWLSASSAELEAGALLDVAEWNWRCVGKPDLAVRQFQMAFAAHPHVGTLADSHARYHAACAALAAAATRTCSPADSERWRACAFEWLTGERDTLISRREVGDAPARIAVAAEFRSWLNEPAFAAAQRGLSFETGPVEEVHRWEQFWGDVRRSASLDDPIELLTQARRCAAMSDWARAAERYTTFLHLQPDQFGDASFELAAVQLLSDDVDGYHRTFAGMLDALATAPTMRRYLIARTFTLGRPAGVDLQRIVDIGIAELQQFPDSAWAMTEAAALMVRVGQNTEAIALLKRSIERDSRPGTAVLNWLWLALAHNKAGNPGEARRWFAKAEAWIQPLGGEQPPADGPSSMHLHNWLESQILRREAATILASPGGSVS